MSNDLPGGQGERHSQLERIPAGSPRDKSTRPSVEVRTSRREPSPKDLMEIEINRMELVRWVDACGPDSATPLTAVDVIAMKPLPMNDIGFLVSEDSKCIVLAPELSDDGIIRRAICIPKGCIVKRVRLEKARRK